MSTAAVAQYCHILKADKTATEFLTKGRLWMASDTGLQRDSQSKGPPFFTILYNPTFKHETFTFIKIKSQEVRQEVWNHFSLSLITLCTTRRCDGL